MFYVTEVVEIARPIEEVFAFIVDARNRGRWDTSVISEEQTSPGPVGVGTTLSSVMSVMGREVAFDWRVSHFDAPRRMTIESTAGPMATGLTFTLSKASGVTRLGATLEGEPSGMMRFVEPMIADGVRANLAGGLERMRAVLEAEGSPA